MAYLSQLRTFVAAYRLGSLSKAAAYLAITQPAASQHIRLLENHIQKPLFVRHARGIVPTVVAHDLARAIAPHIDGIEDGFSAIQARATSIAGTLHIAGPGEYLSAKIIPRLAGLMAQDIRVHFHTGGKSRIYKLLDEGVVDLAVTASQPESRTLDYQVIDRETLILVAAPVWIQQVFGHLPNQLPDQQLSQLQNKQQNEQQDKQQKRTLNHVSVDQLMAELIANALIAYDDELPLIRQYFNQVFKTNLKVQAAVTVSDLRMVRSLIVARQGYSVLPQYLCEQALANGELSYLYTPKIPPTNSLYLVWHRDKLSHPCVAYARQYFLGEGEHFNHA